MTQSGDSLIVTTIADLWLLTYDGRPPDMRAPLFSSRQIELAVARTNDDRRDLRTDWTAVDLEEMIRLEVEACAATSRASMQLPIAPTWAKLNTRDNLGAVRRPRLRIVPRGS